jgi:SAM-dependent methyltransferase
VIDKGCDVPLFASAPILAQELTTELASEATHLSGGHDALAIDESANLANLSHLHVLAAIDVPSNEVASNRGVIGIPLTLARRATLRLLRPFLQPLLSQVTVFNRAVADELVLDQTRKAQDTEALTAQFATQLEEVRHDLDQLRTLTGVADHRTAQLECFASTIDDRLMPTVYTVNSMQTVDGMGRSTIGFSDGAGAIASPYEAFEAAFRGSRERVSDLLKTYGVAFDGCEHVLDVGCGRGEFIELLGAREIRATGVDLDEGMLATARKRDLDVHQTEAVAWLRSNPGLYDGLFSSQVVEHLTFEQLSDLLSTAVSSLRPGAPVIIETVNPYCAAGLQAFRTDPTHTALIFPEVLAVMAQAAGFASASVTFPCEWTTFDAARRTSPSYALIAHTPTGRLTPSNSD